MRDRLEQVLHYWFRELPREAWFRKDAAVDRTIADRFGALHAELDRAAPYACLSDPRAALAAVIVLDQFSRNMFRDTPRAFGSDAHALTLAELAVARGFDQRVDAAERVFFYLPFEHSEDAAIQVRSIALFERHGDAEALKWALAHKVIIDRFGRYPHRNAILGRASTAEEVAFLATPGSSF